MSSEQEIASLQQVLKSYRLGELSVTALDDVSLRIGRSSLVFILGPSGSGKTTLLNLLGALDRPTADEVRLLGTPTTALSDNQLSDLRNRQIGTIFQSFNLIKVLSAQENVEYPLLLQRIPKRERQERSRAILHAVGLDERRRHRPNQLSGGQRQRVAIARALVKNPALVLADEPTANLDSRTSREIVELIQAVQDEFRTTFLCCTHDPEILRHASQVVHLLDGKIVHEEREPRAPRNTEVFACGRI